MWPVRVALKYCLNNLLIVNIWKKNRKFRSYLNLTVPSMTRISFDESKKTEEVEQIWNTMSGEPVVADIDLFEEDSQSVKLMMISLAILSVEKKVKG